MTLMDLNALMDMRAFFRSRANQMGSVMFHAMRGYIDCGLRFSDLQPPIVLRDENWQNVSYWSKKQKIYIPVSNGSTLQDVLYNLVSLYQEENELKSYSTVVEWMRYNAPGFRMHQNNCQIWVHVFRSVEMKRLHYQDSKTFAEIRDIYKLSSDLVAQAYVLKPIYYTGIFPWN